MYTVELEHYNKVIEMILSCLLLLLLLLLHAKFFFKRTFIHVHLFCPCGDTQGGGHGEEF